MDFLKLFSIEKEWIIKGKNKSSDKIERKKKENC